MECHDQPSIDAILSLPAHDIATIQSNIEAHFKETKIYSRPTSNRLSRSSTSSSYYGGLTSTMTMVYPDTRIRKTSLIMPPEMSVLKTSYPMKSSYSSTDDYTTDNSPESASTFSMIYSSPSLVSTPLTPPTPRSPLLPNFPDLNLSVAIYKDIPFSPTVPTFTDCPFQYYREDIPPCKTHQSLRLTIGALSAVPRSPIALFCTSPEAIVHDSTDQDSDSDNDADSDDGGTIIFDDDDDDDDDEEDSDDVSDAGLDSGDEGESVDTTTLAQRLNDTDMIAFVQSRAMTSPTRSTRSTTRLAEMNGLEEARIDSTIKNWYESMSLDAQLRELETTYNQLKGRQRMSMEESSRVVYRAYQAEQSNRRSCI